jgi:hypothetical protein
MGLCVTWRHADGKEGVRGSHMGVMESHSLSAGMGDSH